MDDQYGFAVNLLHLLRCDQVGHAHGPPAALALPQHRVHGGEEGTDVTLLPLDPVQDLYTKNKSKGVTRGQTGRGVTPGVRSHPNYRPSA